MLITRVLSRSVRCAQETRSFWLGFLFMWGMVRGNEMGVCMIVVAITVCVVTLLMYLNHIDRLVDGLDEKMKRRKDRDEER